MGSCELRDAIRQLRASPMRHVRAVELIGNTRSVWSYLQRADVSSRKRSEENGEELLERTRGLFVEHGFEVRRRTISSADCDLVHMARADCLIVGGSGFGKLAASLARGAVFRPTCNG